MNESSVSLSLPNDIASQMKQHANSMLPLEVCGLLSGMGRQIITSIPVTNVLESPHAFKMDPEEQLKAFKKIEDLGQELIGVYHSHPQGPALPSQTDLDSHFYPGVYAVILSRSADSWKIRAFDIRDGRSTWIPLEIK